MINQIKYPSLNAKMKGMYANNFSAEEFKELLRQNSLKEAIFILKAKFPGLDNLNEKMHRKEIEQELNNLFIVEILKLCKYLNKKEIEIFMLFLSKYKISCVKNVFRNVVTNRDSQIYLKNIDNWTTKMFKSIDGINEIYDEISFIEKIQDEEFYEIFEEYQDNLDDIPLEEIEGKLDKYYFIKMYNLSKKINKEFELMIGTEIDLFNIICIYRGKKYFKYSDEEIRKILIPINYKISKNDTELLITSQSFDEIKSILQKTKYRNIFADESNIEHDKDKYLYHIYLKIFKTKMFNICTIFCLINLTGIEIKNLINIIEGIRYKIDKKELQKRIII